MQEQQLNFAGQEPELSEEELESVAGGDINIRIKIKW